MTKACDGGPRANDTSEKEGCSPRGLERKGRPRFLCVDLESLTHSCKGEISLEHKADGDAPRVGARCQLPVVVNSD